MRLLILSLVLASTATARAEGPTVRAEGETSSQACEGGQALLEGNRNVVAFTGACSGVRIRGEGNVVTAGLAAGASIDIEGSRNRLRFSTAKGAPPQLHVSGGFNDVAPGPNALAPAADTARLAGDDLTLVLDCGGKAVTLQGTRTHVTLRGACTALTVRGQASDVHAELAPKANVLVEGNGITLTYNVKSGGAGPALSVNGMGSSAVREGATIAAKPEPPAERGSASHPAAEAPVASVPQLMHDLDASVVAKGTLVHLPSAAFAAAGLTPAGQTQMLRLASLVVQTHPSGLLLTGRDPADPALASARREVVKEFLSAHGAGALAVNEGADVAAAGVDVLLLR